MTLATSTTNRARDIFLELVEKQSPEEWQDHLASACAGSHELEEEVRRLLFAHGQLNSFMGHQAAGPAATVDQPDAASRAGSQIGPYKLLEQIGEGGMGVVYVAEQTEPVRRRVALKIIKPGMDTKQVIARFEAERQALAMMDHPHIAKVLDGGTTDAGRPYFVMELVRGLPVTEYCDKTRLSPRQRLGLFIDVCHAVQHAHQKGVIHRDLKPSNVMITVHDGRPVAKVIDFGVAKAVGQQLTERTVYTAHTQLVGTPLYMSPEQADFSSQDVDTRSDVYSLGVLLYELLTGQTPFDKETLTKAGFDEMRRIIREDEPPSPSRRFSTLSAQAISTVSQHRSVDERHLGRVLRGELDWIVMKALEKDRSRRYESASALAADIQRYLSDEPVLACPPTTMYRFQKFARKHKPALVTAAAIAACLILGTTVSAWQAVRATTAEAQATANEAQAKEAATAEAQQRQRAEANEQKANAERDEVKALNDQLRRTLYASNMNLAKSAWDAGNVRRVKELLTQHRSKQGETDLRGFEWYYLDRLCHLELLTLDGHTAGVDCVVFSPDGERLASASGKVVKIWDAQTGRELLALKEHTAEVWDLAFSPDGKRLASTAHRGAVIVWDAQTGQVMVSITGGGMSVAFSPDGKRVTSRSKVWDAQTGEELIIRQGGGILNGVFSPDGQRMAISNGPEMAVKVIDAQSGQEFFVLKGHTGTIRRVVFSPDGTRLATASADRTVRVWDAQTGEQVLAINGHTGNILGLAFSPDGKRLASGSVDQTVRLWNAQTGQELFSIKGHTGVVYSVSFSADGKRLASSSEDRTVKIWDATATQEFRVFSGHTGYVASVAFSADGKRLASAASGTTPPLGEMKVWDTQSSRELISIHGGSNGTNWVACSPDGNRVATKTWDGKVKLWDVQSGEELLALMGNTGSVRRPVFSPDGKRMATASADRTAKIWDAQTGTEVLTLKGHADEVTSVVFSTDGKRVASSSNDKTVKVWDAQTGEQLITCKGHTGNVWRVAFAPDGKRLASTCANLDAEVKVWDAQTGQEILSLKGHTSEITSVGFSPDGKRLVSASSDNTAKIWDTLTGQETMTLHDSGPTVVFSPNGWCLAGGGPYGKVTIYDATPLPETP